MAQALGLEQDMRSAQTGITSLTGKIWRLRDADTRLAQTLTQQHDLELLVAQVLAARKTDPATIPQFLAPRLKDWLPDPFTFRDMDKAAARIVDAIQKKQKIALFGDYDVDGATSTALMGRFLRSFGLEPTLYIPDRMLEGYGPNVNAFQQLIDDKHDLIITLDCGVLGFEPLQLAHDQGVDVVVLDHHMAAPELPKAVAVVNPNRMDETAGYGYMAAVGVTFVTLVAVCQLLRKQNITPPDLLEWLDLVALGTVCDVVPMIELNRAFVAQGLKIMAKRQNMGLRALADVAGIAQTPTTYHAGFVFGPRINAGGRIASSNLGVQLLTSHDPIETERIAQELDNLNKDRQTLERQSVEEALGMVTRDEEKFSHIITLASKDWHPGVIGLIAARLKEQFQRPVCAIALDENGKGKASGRSITGLDLGALVIKSRLEGLIKEGGGHAMAAGFSVSADKLDELHQFFHQCMVDQFGPQLPPPEISVDGVIALAAVRLQVVKQLQQLEPHGPGNAAPRFILSPVRLQRVDVVKEKHLRLTVSDGGNQQRLGVMLFGQGNTPLHRQLEGLMQQNIAILGSLKINSWQGREEAQFIADDIAVME